MNSESTLLVSDGFGFDGLVSLVCLIHFFAEIAFGILALFIARMKLMVWGV